MKKLTKQPNFVSGVLERPDYKADKRNFCSKELIVSAPPVNWKEKSPDSFESNWEGQYTQDGSGSCYAWSLSLLLENMNEKEEGKKVKFSARDIYANCCEPYPIAGLYVEKTMKWLNKNGATLEYLLPSNNLDELTMRKLNDFKAGDRQVAIGAGANLMADVKLKEAQANNLNADTESKKSVVVDEAKARIDQLKQLTDNEKVQEAILEYERQLKAIETDVQRRTADDRVKAVNLANEQLQKVITGEGLNNALKEGVLEDLIKQANQTTFEQQLRMQGIDLNNETMKRRLNMLSTELTLTKEQIARLKAMSQHEQNEEIMRMKEIAIKKLEQEFKTSNTQEVKLWNDMANGWANTILNAVR